jgi:hypothetical protein
MTIATFSGNCTMIFSEPKPAHEFIRKKIIGKSLQQQQDDIKVEAGGAEQRCKMIDSAVISFSHQHYVILLAEVSVDEVEKKRADSAMEGLGSVMKVKDNDDGDYYDPSNEVFPSLH